MISIVQGAGCDDIDLVLSEFGDFKIDKVIVRLNSDLWEMETFPAAIRQIANENPNEAVFYAHAKGVSHAGASLTAAKIWTATMMKFLLGNREKVIDKLGRYSAVGSFKESNGAFNTNWHFSGTFFAMRHDKVFTRPQWSNFPPHRYFIEFFPSTHVPAHEAFNLCPVRRPRQWLDGASWEALIPALAAAEHAWLEPK